jgi:hypothetical protein
MLLAGDYTVLTNEHRMFRPADSFPTTKVKGVGRSGGADARAFRAVARKAFSEVREPMVIRYTQWMVETLNSWY